MEILALKSALTKLKLSDIETNLGKWSFLRRNQMQLASILNGGTKASIIAELVDICEVNKVFNSLT